MLQEKRPQAPWLWTFAMANGFKYEEDSLPSARGTAEGRGVSVVVDVVEEGSALKPVPKLRMEIDLHGRIPDDIECVQYAWPKLRRWVPWLNRGHIKTGDEEFDQKIWVSSQHTDRLLAYLTPERRAAVGELLALQDNGPLQTVAMMTGGKWRGNDLGRPRLIFTLDISDLGGAEFAMWLAIKYKALMNIAPRLDGGLIRSI